MNNNITNNYSLLHYVIQHANKACLIVSAIDLLILEINLEACRMLERNRDDLINSPLSTIETALQDIFFWDELNSDPTSISERIIESEWLTNTGIPIPIEKRVIYCLQENIGYWIIYVDDITSKKRIAEEQLYLSSQLQSSLEATAEGIMSVNLQGKIININRRFINLWKLQDELLVEYNADTVFKNISSSLQKKMDWNNILKKIEDYSECDTENNLLLKDGRHLVFSSKPEYLRDHLIGRVYSVRDISAMKKIEQELVDALTITEEAVQEKSYMIDALKVSELRLRRIINSSLIGICQGDMHGHLTLANDAFIQLLGINRRNLSNNTLDWLTHAAPGCEDILRTSLDELRNIGNISSFNTNLMHTNGSIIPVLIGLSQLEGSEFEWVGFVLDLTEQTKADRMKSEFISVVSHELRTPITSIRGAMSILESGASGALPNQALQLIKIAHRNSQRLGALVNDILDMEKLISGKMSFQSTIFDLQLLVEQSLEANASYATNFDVKYQFNSQTSLKDVIGDPERTMQVLANLLSNAAKFSPRGEHVDIIISAQKNGLRVQVDDKGPGIPLEFRDRIFTKFAQADGTNTRKQGGTGLGLSIAKSMVEKMGGDIGFNSEEGKGSQFWFTLPRPTC